MSLYDKAVSQCRLANRYLVALKLPVELGYHGEPLEAALAAWMDEWRDSPAMMGLLVLPLNRRSGMFTKL